MAYDWGNWNHDIWLYADKWTMGPLRIALFFIWFPVLFWLLRRYEYRLNKATRGVVELLGRNSLFVYTAHAFIVFALKIYVIPPKTTFWQNFLITVVALAALIGITILYNRLRPALSNLSARLYKLSPSKS
jgi:fucose 4-O-acetylase-like acetyltransferase